MELVVNTATHVGSVSLVLGILDYCCHIGRKVTSRDGVIGNTPDS